MSLKRILLYLTMVALAALWLGKTPVGADDWQPIDPADLKMTSEPKAPGAPAIYLYRQVDRSDSGNVTSEFNYARIKVLTEDGRKYGDVEIPFDKGSETVSGIRARTIHPDGSVVNSDGKVYEKMIVKAKGVKYLAKTFTMPDVTVGSIVEYQFYYNFNDRYIFNSHWILSAELFTRQGKFSLKPYQEPPWMVQWISPAGLPAGTEQAKQGPDAVIRLTARDIPAFQVEDFMPPENELKYRVDFIYRDSMPERDMEKFWANYAKKHADYVERFVNKKKAMEQAVAGIVSTGDPPEAKLRKIYARTQQIRNLSYEESKTVEEEKREKLKASGSAEDVLKNGYAYGGSITWTFMALARAAGFEALPMMVSPRSEYFFKPSRMNSAELNASVVMIKVDGKELYCDPGTLFAPFCVLPWQESGVPGRLLDKDGGKWITTPAATSKDTKIQRFAQFNLSDQGTLDGTVTLTYTGIEAMNRRQEQRIADDEARKRYLEDQLKEYIPVGADVELKSKPDWKSSDAPLAAEFEVKIQGWVSGAGRRAMMPVGVFSGSEKRVFDHADRVQPVYYPYFYTKEDVIKIELPLGWHVSSVPNPQDLDAKAAEYTVKCEDQKTAVQINRMLRIDLFMVPKETYPVLRNFYQAVRTGDEEQIVLQPSGTAARN